MLSLELAGPIASIEPEARPTPAVPDQAALILVRLHTLPIGTIDVTTPGGRLDATDLVRAVGASLGTEIRKHLERDGLAAVALTTSGVGVVEEPPCLADRRRFLASAPPVTVVVPVADRPDLLATCLADLLDQSYPGFEIVVVDNAPGRSGAREAVDRAVERHGEGDLVAIRYVVEPSPGSSIARNRGLAASGTGITAFLDADVRVDPHWLGELVRPIADDPSVACATGLIMPAELGTQAQAWLMEWGGYDKGLEPRVFDLGPNRDPSPLYPFQPGLYGSGQSMAFRTAVLRELGGFDLALGVKTPSQGGEDLAALLDVVLAGHRLAYVPTAIVWHPDPPEARSFVAKLESYAVGLGALMARTAVVHPGAGPAIALRLPGAVWHLFAPRSRRNRRRSRSFPGSAVTRAEVRGLLRGPVAYAKSRRALRAARRS